MSTSKMNHARVFHPLKILQLLMLYRNRVTCITSVFWKKNSTVIFNYATYERQQPLRLRMKLCK